MEKAILVLTGRIEFTEDQDILMIVVELEANVEEAVERWTKLLARCYAGRADFRSVSQFGPNPESVRMAESLNVKYLGLAVNHFPIHHGKEDLRNTLTEFEKIVKKNSKRLGISLIDALTVRGDATKIADLAIHHGRALIENVEFKEMSKPSKTTKKARL